VEEFDTMKKRTKSLLAAFCTMALCGSLIAGSTYALFTSSGNVNISVTSGKVEVEANIDSKSVKVYSASTTADDSKTVIDTTNMELGDYDGTYYYVSKTVSTDSATKKTSGSFTNGGTATLVGDTLTLDKVTPGDKVDFEINITNKSNVAIQYRVVIECVGDPYLFSGLDFNVGGSSFNQTVYYSSTWSTPETQKENSTIATVPVTVTLPLDAGDSFQNKSTSIRYTVEAVQANAAIAKNEEVKTKATFIEGVDNMVSTSDGYLVTIPDEIDEEEGIVFTDKQTFTVSVPAAAVSESASNLVFNIEESSTVQEGITLSAAQTAKTLNITLDGISSENSTPITVNYYIGEDLTGVCVYHYTDTIESTYDVKTGYVTFTTTSFSPFTVQYNKPGDGKFTAGFGTAEEPYIISTKEELMKIGYKGIDGNDIDGEDYFYNIVFVLANDIDMENTPIRNLGLFRGLLDGRGHKLLNVNFTSESDVGYGYDVGLFAGLNGGNNKEIYEATTDEELASEYCHNINGKNYIITSGAVMNLTFESGTIYSNINGAVSPLGSGQCTAYIINVVNKIDVQAEGDAYFVAGIVSGTRGTGLVINCTNYGNITYTGTPSSSVVVGGITAQLFGGSDGSTYPDILRPYSAAVYNCVNYGNISATGSYVGGIVGQIHGYDYSLKKAIVDCINNGNISGKENVGGIVGGNCSSGVTLYLVNNTNNGTVSLLEGGVENTVGTICGKNDGIIYFDNSSSEFNCGTNNGTLYIKDGEEYKKSDEVE
jgi:predicted ribosomally synthesized peptide with SipW-like signal peptide